jgi:hypothetical protein
VPPLSCLGWWSGVLSQLCRVQHLRSVSPDTDGVHMPQRIAYFVLVRQSAHLHVTRHKSPKLRYGCSYCYVGDSEVAYT